MLQRTQKYQEELALKYQPCLKCTLKIVVCVADSVMILLTFSSLGYSKVSFKEGVLCINTISLFTSSIYGLDYIYKKDTFTLQNLNTQLVEDVI